MPVRFRRHVLRLKIRWHWIIFLFHLEFLTFLIRCANDSIINYSNRMSLLFYIPYWRYQNHLPLVSEDPSVYVKSVIHKTFCEVNEKGTEAAAVTVVVMKSRCAILKPAEPCFTMCCIRPFLFTVVHDMTHTILFAGVIETPTHA